MTYTHTYTTGLTIRHHFTPRDSASDTLQLFTENLKKMPSCVVKSRKNYMNKLKKSQGITYHAQVITVRDIFCYLYFIYCDENSKQKIQQCDHFFLRENFPKSGENCICYICNSVRFIWYFFFGNILILSNK